MSTSVGNRAGELGFDALHVVDHQVVLDRDDHGDVGRTRGHGSGRRGQVGPEVGALGGGEERGEQEVRHGSVPRSGRETSTPGL